MNLKTLKSAVVPAYKAMRRPEWVAPKERVKLTKAEKKKIEKLWGEVWSKPSFGWHEHYKAVNGEFDARYLPTDVFYLDLLPKLSNRLLAAAWEDKAYYNVRYPDVSFPKLLMASIDGRLHDGDLSPIGWDAAYKIVKARRAVFAKPSIESARGIGAFKLDTSEVSGPKDLKARLSKLNENFVVQDLVEQHEMLSRFNSSSVNIMRLNSVRLDGEPFLANASVRFGAKGEVTDIAYINGVETTNAVGIKGDGRLKDFYSNQDGLRRPIADIGFGSGDVIPGFADVVECCASIHRRMHHFGIVAFDVTVDKAGKPLVIETNLTFPGTVFYQYANGPFFGDRTEEVIEWCKARKHASSLKGILV